MTGSGGGSDGGGAGRGWVLSCSHQALSYDDGFNWWPRGFYRHDVGVEIIIVSGRGMSCLPFINGSPSLRRGGEVVSVARCQSASRFGLTSVRGQGTFRYSSACRPSLHVWRGLKLVLSNTSLLRLHHFKSLYINLRKFLRCFYVCRGSMKRFIQY